MSLYLKAYRLLDRRERRRAWLMLGLVLVLSLFETVSAVSVMPFLAVLASPQLIEENGVLATAYRISGAASREDFLILLGFAAFGLLVLSAAARALGQYAVIRFTQQRGYSIGRRLLEAYLRRPYAFFLTRHSGELSRALLAEVNTLIVQVYAPLTNLVVQVLLVLALTVMLVIVNPLMALVGLGLLGGCYGLIFLTLRPRLDRMGADRVAANKARFRLAAETFGGIKTIKLQGAERQYLGRFGDTALRLARLQASSQTLAALPRYAIEALAFGGIILLALALMLQHRDDPAGALGRILPLLGVYAFAGYRLMPALQGIYAALSQIRFGAPVLEAISADLEAARGLPALAARPPAPLPMRQAVELKGLGFRHDGAAEPSLSGIDVTIPAGTSLGIVGPTGAGKTTLVDVFLGLLAPETGEIRVDGVPVTAANRSAWQADLGYVPQDIFLLAASIAENIGFGLSRDQLDMERVRQSARMAQILDFIESLPEGFDTDVGERGVRLSGGQRQRIGIARALYRDPAVLVFDEATSALDTATERGVVEAIAGLSGTKTLLIIAHRISTVQGCDQILVLEQGRVAALGDYATLAETSPAFRRLLAARDAAA